MSDTAQTKAPWTDDQVSRLNAYQKSGWHPFTCGNNRGNAAHEAYQREHGGDFGELVATKDGWICPACDYKQNWAHAFMAEHDFKPFNLEADPKPPGNAT